MGLSVDPVLTFAPATIAKAGDNTVIVTFERRSTGASTAETTAYSIAQGQPYVFANASEPNDPKVIQAPRQQVTLNPSDRRQTLVLRRTKSPAVITMVLVNADVTEVDDKGRPTLDGDGQPLPAHRSSGFIVVQG